MGSDKWYRVPFEHAPSQGGYDYVPIKLTGKKGGGYVVNIDFQPLWDAARGSDWRACFVAVNDNGEPRYSNEWNSGVNSITPFDRREQAVSRRDRGAGFQGVRGLRASVGE